ncbi:hypothetical protein [Rhabdochromatium marinum]|uniref:hypothetical protein n=1 Tax=Rhabdochromatium marinum TaxID=48729 RepID=UPI0019049751|nr:hypothetical protein [Rhabdochromatium marinum]
MLVSLGRAGGVLKLLRQNPSSQIVTVARQLLTHRWWNEELGQYELVISQYVIDEASAGNPSLAAERMQLLGTVSTSLMQKYFLVFTIYLEDKVFRYP